MKGPLFYSKILLFGEYGIIEDSKGLSIPYNFFNGALKIAEKPPPLDMEIFILDLLFSVIFSNL